MGIKPYKMLQYKRFEGLQTDLELYKRLCYFTLHHDWLGWRGMTAIAGTTFIHPLAPQSIIITFKHRKVKEQTTKDLVEYYKEES